MMFNGSATVNSVKLACFSWSPYLRSFSLLYSFSKYAMSASMHWGGMCWALRRGKPRNPEFLPQSVHSMERWTLLPKLTHKQTRRMLRKALWKVKLEQGDSKFSLKSQKSDIRLTYKDEYVFGWLSFPCLFISRESGEEHLSRKNVEIFYAKF